MTTESKFVTETIELIGGMDYREDAWRLSRPYMTESDVVDMTVLDKTDFSLQMLKQVVIKCKTSAFFRELLTTIRPYGMWSQSSRVNKLADTKLPREFIDSCSRSESTTIKFRLCRRLEELAAEFNDATDKSAQDTIRLGLPLLHISEYTFSTDIRTMICFLKSLKLLLPLEYRHYGKMIESALNLDDLNTYRFPPMYTEVWSAEDEVLDHGTVVVGSTVIIKEDISLSLRAQLARHTGIVLKDNLLWSSSTLVSELDLNSRCTVVMIVPKDMWIKVIKHRSCFVSHYELGYSKFIMSYLESNHRLSFVDMLPCSGQKSACSCAPDIESRLRGDDPGIACPLWTLRQDEVNRRIATLGDDPISQEYKVLVTRLTNLVPSGLEDHR